MVFLPMRRFILVRSVERMKMFYTSGEINCFSKFPVFFFFFNTKWVLAGNVRILLKQIMFETHKLAIIHFLKNYKKENPFSITFLSEKHPCTNEEVYLISINWNKKSYRTIKHERKPNNYQQLSDTIISSSWASHVMEHCTHTMH